MAKSRIVNTRFWDDSYIARLSPQEKLVFLYLLTSPLTTIAGVYELPLKRASFDIGLAIEEVAAAVSRFQAEEKIIRWDDWIGIVNFTKHQSLNPKILQGILTELENVPSDLIQKLNLESLVRYQVKMDLEAGLSKQTADKRKEMKDKINDLVRRWKASGPS